VREIVDGNNLIGRLGPGTREGLVSELCEVARRGRKRLTVVFDGPPDAGRPKADSGKPAAPVNPKNWERWFSDPRNGIV
jgi:hypothetical protein